MYSASLRAQRRAPSVRLGSSSIRAASSGTYEPLSRGGVCRGFGSAGRWQQRSERHCRTGSLWCIGFLLGYEKTRRISGRKKPSQKALAFLFGSARVGTAKYPALTELQFLEGPPPGGFSLFRS